MPGLVNLEIMDLISRLRGEIQDMLGGQLKLKMFIWDLLENHPGENAVGVMFVIEADADPDVEASGSGPDPIIKLVGKHRDFQQFLNKEGPFYEQEFMLDLEFDYGTGVCTIHHINLPGQLRNKGLGTAIAEKTERLAVMMGMELMYVPSEHRATSFWLRNGYRFDVPGEQSFYEKNRDKSNLYVAYDLKKKISGQG